MNPTVVLAFSQPAYSQVSPVPCPNYCLRQGTAHPSLSPRASPAAPTRPCMGCSPLNRRTLSKWDHRKLSLLDASQASHSARSSLPTTCSLLNLLLPQHRTQVHWRPVTMPVHLPENPHSLLPRGSSVAATVLPPRMTFNHFHLISKSLMSIL